jgi:hypothetical protein
MWSLLPLRLQVTALAIANVLALSVLHAAYSYLHDGQTAGPFQWFAISVTIVTGGIISMAEGVWRWVWRMIPAIQGKAFPDLNGVWKGVLRSTWNNLETKQGIPPIDATITIRQRLFTTHVSLKTNESVSHSTRVWLERFPETRRFRIWYSYDNEPRAILQHRSPQHEGVAFLELNFDADQNRLIGSYYTARRTMGDIDVSRTITDQGSPGQQVKQMKVQ